jgi:hypothetical protein
MRVALVLFFVAVTSAAHLSGNETPPVDIELLPGVQFVSYQDNARTEVALATLQLPLPSATQEALRKVKSIRRMKLLGSGRDDNPLRVGEGIRGLQEIDVFGCSIGSNDAHILQKLPARLWLTISECTLDEDAFEGIADSKIESLHIHDSHYKRERFDLTECKSLRRLVVTNSPLPTGVPRGLALAEFSDFDEKAAALLEKCDFLKEVSLGGGIITFEVLDLLPKSLARISLNKCMIRSPVGQFPNLRWLRIKDCCVNGTLLASAGTPELRVLECHGMCLAGDVIGDLHACKKVTHLTIASCTFDFAVSKCISRCHSLSKLDLSHSDADAAAFMEALRAPNVKLLEVSSTCFDDNHLASIASKELVALYAAHTTLSDAGLADAASYSALKELCVEHTQVSTSALVELVSQSKSIQSIGVSSTQAERIGRDALKSMRNKGGDSITVITGRVSE